MKQVLIIISAMVIVFSFVSCSANNSGSKNVSTTAVTDIEGQTHYYEPVTEKDGSTVINEEGSGVYAELETQADGKAVTKKNGTYVTNENTTVLPVRSMTEKASSTAKTTAKGQPNTASKDISDADNEIEFEPEPGGTTTAKSETKPTEKTTVKEPTTAEITEKTTEKATEKTTQPATDSDGWITKWY